MSFLHLNLSLLTTPKWLVSQAEVLVRPARRVEQVRPRIFMWQRDDAHFT